MSNRLYEDAGDRPDRQKVPGIFSRYLKVMGRSPQEPTMLIDTKDLQVLYCDQCEQKIEINGIDQHWLYLIGSHHLCDKCQESYKLPETAYLLNLKGSLSQEERRSPQPLTIA